jgi:membrane protein YqaA with SNARE-associated domain
VDYAAALAVVFAVNLLPAFGPPTWAVMVFFRVTYGLAAVPLVLGGALAAASGRFVLATVTRHFRGRLSDERRERLAAAEEALVGTRGRAFAGLGLFALSPVPSAQLFVAAGLLTVPLVPLTAAFFAGRLVSYAIYVGAASLAAASLGEVFDDALTSPLGIGLQLVMLALLVLLLRVDWPRVLTRGRAAGDASSDAAGAPASDASATPRGTTRTGQGAARRTGPDTLPTSARRKGP